MTSERANYRKIYESYHGPIPKDEEGRSYEIHHKDGNPSNNSIDNLLCVSISDHFKIHYEQQDWGACLAIAIRMSTPPHNLSELARNACLKRVAQGNHPFLNGEISRKTNQRRREDGSLSAVMKRTNKRRMEEGVHQNLLAHECPHCNKTGKGPGFKHVHFDNCIKVKPEWAVTCPHCNKRGDARGPIMLRWHFDNCHVVNPSKNRKSSIETKQKISKGLKGKSKGWQLTPESRQRQKESVSNALQGKNKIRIQCPHCHKIGGKPAMTRFHMNNCKERFKCE